MKDIIDRLENATGPDRKLDIELALIHTKTDNESKIRSAVEAGWMPPGDTWPMKFTASIDAALTLLPDGWHWRMDQGRNAGASLYRDGFPQHFSVADTPAIALCIVALKARSALATAKSGQP